MGSGGRCDSDHDDLLGLSRGWWDACTPPTIAPTEMGGRTIFQAERVEVGVELAPGTFTLQPSTESDLEK